MDEASGLTDTTASTNGSIQSTLNEVTIIAVSVTASLSALLGLTLIVTPLIVFGLRRHCKHDKENERYTNNCVVSCKYLCVICVQSYRLYVMCDLISQCDSVLWYPFMVDGSNIV